MLKKEHFLPAFMLFNYTNHIAASLLRQAITSKPLRRDVKLDLFTLISQYIVTYKPH